MTAPPKNILESFKFVNPTKLFYGKNAIEDLFPFVKENGVKKVLALFGSGSSKKNGVYERVVKGLNDNSVEFIELWGVQPNPVISKVREAVAITKDEKNGIEAVLAVGGGSVLDSAKAICFGRYFEGDPWELFLKKDRPSKHLPLYTVLTLSATASEYDAGGVVSNLEQKLKLGAGFDFPVASAVDPTVQFSLPWRQIFCGAVDSLSHSMESYFSSANESYAGREVNLGIQRSIIKSMEKLVVNPNDYDARASFCFATSLAISGYQSTGLSGDWNVHHVEHAISAFDENVAHGEGLAVVSLQYYPYLLEKKPELKEQFEQWAERIFGTTDVQTAFGRFRELYVLWKTPLTLKDLRIPKEAINEIADIHQGHKKAGMVSPLFPLAVEDTREILTRASGW